MSLRKTVCTATVFVVLMAGLASLVVIKVPDRVWWSARFSYSDKTAIIMWLFGNVMTPAGLACGAVLIVWGLWKLSAAICSNLGNNYVDKSM